MKNSSTSSESSAAANVINSGNLQTSLISVNMINVTKLSSTNYITWSAQIRSLLRGYDLLKYINSDAVIPPSTITKSGNEEPNPEYTTWQRQDSLLFSALMGSLEIAHPPLIATSETSLEAWTTLSATYAKPSRGHIKQLKEQLKRCNKGTTTIDVYMQQIKATSDALALLGSPLGQEDLTDAVLAGLGEDYKSLAESIHNRDSPISFPELYEKLINRELAIAVDASSSSQPFPITANHAQHRSSNGRHHNNKITPITNHFLANMEMIIVVVDHTLVNAKHVERKGTV
ncbi:hypothetical protein AALP_AA8G430600 [Arabis alpina]|uniref:Retrotransposon Copia-like N-terminal domain-containing protein n=1 Tax=Arabis alpina TaxID=50452 RepID=A0A087GD43_ARAAL|nr:hypothetical protein AALP_AA8G430600 [Arabis alpina]